MSREINHDNLGRNDPGFPIGPPKIKTTVKEREEEAGEEAVDLRRSSRQETTLKTGRYLIINENIPKRVFKLVAHNEFEMKMKREAIKNHNIVYFIHTENDQYICPTTSDPRSFSRNASRTPTRRKSSTDSGKSRRSRPSSARSTTFPASPAPRPPPART